LLPFAVRELTGSRPGGFTLVLGAWGAGALPLVVLGCTDQLWLMVVAALVFGVTDSAALIIWARSCSVGCRPTCSEASLASTSSSPSA